MHKQKNAGVVFACTLLFGLVVTKAGANDFCAGAVPGTFMTIDIPGATFVSASGINPAGEIVGRYIADGVTHAFLLSQGTLSTIDVPGASFTSGRDINAQGDISGNYVSGGVTHGFVLSRGAFATIDVPGAS